MRVALLHALALLLLLANTATQAADKTWLKAGGVGDWTNGTNWTTSNPPGSGPPLAGDHVFVTSVAPVAKTVFYDDTVNRLYSSILIDESGGGSITLQQLGNRLSSFSMTVGLSGGQTIYDFGGGSASFLNMTLNNGGTLAMSGAASLSTGVLTQNGGVASIGANASLSAATFNMNGGTFAGSSTLTVSETFTRTLGAFTGPVVCGTFTQASGSFDGMLTVLNTLNVNTNFSFNGSLESHAPYTLPNNRTFSFAQTFDQVGSTFAQAGFVQPIGPQANFVETAVGGNGTWNQTSGAHTTGVLYVGSQFGAGTYLIGPNSALTATLGLSVGIFGDGTFIQTGGNVTVAGNTFLSRGGTTPPGPHTSFQSISAGTFQNNGTLLVAVKNAIWGQFIQTGGFVRAKGLIVNVDSTSTGTLDISGGTFLVDQNAVNNGVFRQTAGRAEITGVLDGAGDVFVGGSGSLVTSRLRQLSLSIDNNATVFLAGNGFSTGIISTVGATTSRVRSLSFGQNGATINGRLNVGNNRLAIDYAPGQSPADRIRQYLASGRAGGSWTGTGINSTNASLSAGLAALGWAEASAVLGPTGGMFGPDLSVDGSTILVKFTWSGDANLDGQVDVTDLGALATNWQMNNVWTGGDFNYDGFVDVSDLGALATNWQAGVGNPLAPSRLDEALAVVGLSGAAVPEPTRVLAILLLATVIATRFRASRESVRAITSCSCEQLA